jgi:hypothetical protein
MGIKSRVDNLIRSFRTKIKPEFPIVKCVFGREDDPEGLAWATEKAWAEAEEEFAKLPFDPMRPRPRIVQYVTVDCRTDKTQPPTRQQSRPEER